MAKPVKSVKVLSFGYKYSLVPNANCVFDVRFLQNPYYDLELRPLSGLDKKIQNYVLRQKACKSFVRQLRLLVTTMINGYSNFGSQHENIVFAFGCTGGKHRSVTLAITCAQIIRSIYPSVEVTVEHLDLGKE